MAFEFGLLMTLIGVVSVFSSLAVVAFTCVVLKKFSTEELTEKVKPAERPVPTVEEVEVVKAEAVTFGIKLDGEEHEVKVKELGVVDKNSGEMPIPHEIGEEIKVVVDDSEFKVKIEGVSARPFPIEKEPVRIGEVVKEAKNVIKAPMNGTVVKVPVKVGDKVDEGMIVLILEAMKMENTIRSPVSGSIKAIRVSEGDSVNTNDILILID